MSTPDIEHRPGNSAPSRTSRVTSDNKTVSKATDSPGQAQRPAISSADAREQTDDEILGLDPSSDASSPTGRPGSQPGAGADDRSASDETIEASSDSQQEPTHLQSILSANPELRQAWHEAGAYHQWFATPEDARAVPDG